MTGVVITWSSGPAPTPDQLDKVVLSVRSIVIGTTDMMVSESINGLTRIPDAWSCERCDAIFIGEYFSAAHCNETGSDVVLCEQCCTVADHEHDMNTPLTITREHGLWIARRGPTVIGESTSAEMLGSIIDQEARGES